MRALTAPEIVRLWETAGRYHPVDRALSILEPVLPDLDRDELAALPLGQRDTLLLSLRRATFGDTLPAVDHCPECATMVEFELSCSALQNDSAEAGNRQFETDGYCFRIRPLNSFDLAQAATAPSAEAARALLLKHCVAETLYLDKPQPLGALPAEIKTRISDAVLEIDPNAETLLDLRCPDCRHHWQNVLDIGHVLWLEISARAQRLLMEVNMLARAYGWREADIFELSPQRRAAYLKLAAA